MFDQTFVDGAGKTNNGWTVTFSCIAEFAVIGMMILVPLIWTEVLPKAQSVYSLMAPAPPPRALPPPARVPLTRQARVAPRVFQQVPEAPHAISKQAMMPAEFTLPPENLAGVPSGVPDAPTTEMASLFTGGFAVEIHRPAPPPVKTDLKPKQETLLPVGGNLQSAKLIKHPAPTYPSIAKSAHIQGTVVLQAIIGKDGAVRDLKVVSAASPLLVPSAMDAVKQWVYRPTLLNREPVEVITEITVIFSLQ